MIRCSSWRRSWFRCRASSMLSRAATSRSASRSARAFLFASAMASAAGVRPRGLSATRTPPFLKLALVGDVEGVLGRAVLVDAQTLHLDGASAQDGGNLLLALRCDVVAPRNQEDATVTLYQGHGLAQVQ